MELRELLNFFEDYYGGKYTGALLDVMTAYLDGYSREFYLAVQKIMILRFSTCYNKIPCPADIEKNLDEIYEVMPSLKPLLPEPAAEYASPEEAQEWLKDIKGMLRKGTGPLAGAAMKAIGGSENGI